MVRYRLSQSFPIDWLMPRLSLNCRPAHKFRWTPCRRRLHSDLTDITTSVSSRVSHFQSAGQTFIECRHKVGLLRFMPEDLPVSYTHLRAHETPEHLVCR